MSSPSRRKPGRPRKVGALTDTIAAVVDTPTALAVRAAAAQLACTPGEWSRSAIRLGLLRQAEIARMVESEREAKLVVDPVVSS